MPIGIAHDPIIGDRAGRLQPKDLVQRDATRDDAMEVVGGPRRLPKAPIVIGPVLGLEKRIRRGDIGDPVAAQLLHEPILMRAVMTLDAPFGLRELAGTMVIPSFPHMRPKCVSGSAPVARSS